MVGIDTNIAAIPSDKLKISSYPIRFEAIRGGFLAAGGVRGGQQIYSAPQSSTTTATRSCTIGFGAKTTTGTTGFITAAHCIKDPKTAYTPRYAFPDVGSATVEFGQFGKTTNFSYAGTGDESKDMVFMLAKDGAAGPSGTRTGATVGLVEFYADDTAYARKVTSIRLRDSLNVEGSVVGGVIVQGTFICHTGQGATWPTGSTTPLSGSRPKIDSLVRYQSCGEVTSKTATVANGIFTQSAPTSGTLGRVIIVRNNQTASATSAPYLLI